MPDYYYVLGIKHTATTQEIKAAYRNLTKQYHPDVNQDDMFASVKFKAIHEAYETLIDTDKRTAYDAKIKAEINSKHESADNTGAKTHNSSNQSTKQNASYSSSQNAKQNSSGSGQTQSQSKTNSQYNRRTSTQENVYKQKQNSNNESKNHNSADLNREKNTAWIIIIGIVLAVLMNYYMYISK